VFTFLIVTHSQHCNEDSREPPLSSCCKLAEPAGNRPLLAAASLLKVTITIFGTAEPCNPQGSQRLMGKKESILASRDRRPVPTQLLTSRPTICAASACSPQPDMSDLHAACMPNPVCMSQPQPRVRYVNRHTPPWCHCRRETLASWGSSLCTTSSKLYSCQRSDVQTTRCRNVCVRLLELRLSPRWIAAGRC
jgi:hypothetical protein